MYRKIDDHKRTATIHNGIVTMMYDDGWENLLDCKHSFPTNKEASAWLIAGGWEEFDPNADLKAKGFVWNGSYYEYKE